jgi:hypothetical protein
VTAKPSIPWYYWPFWFVILAAGLFVFYVLLTPVWMGIRLVSWLAERRSHEAPADATTAGTSSPDRDPI